jgi:hypothetical protein
VLRSGMAWPPEWMGCGLARVWKALQLQLGGDLEMDRTCELGEEKDSSPVSHQICEPFCGRTKLNVPGFYLLFVLFFIFKFGSYSVCERNEIFPDFSVAATHENVEAESKSKHTMTEFPHEYGSEICETISNMSLKTCMV